MPLESEMNGGTYWLNPERTEIEIKPAGTENAIVINSSGITLTGYTGTPGPQGEQGPQGIQGTQGEQGPQGIQGPTGQGFNWRGAYSGANSYLAYDTVTYNGSSYVCIQANDPGLPMTPDYTDFWQVMATEAGNELNESTVNGFAGQPEGFVFYPLYSNATITNNVVRTFNGSSGDVNYVAPVSSVNGQTGNVTIPIPVTLGVNSPGPSSFWEHSTSFGLFYTDQYGTDHQIL